MTVSLWQRLDPNPARATADVVIVGGGITGLSAALACEARGLRVFLVEQDFVGARASGRNAGYLMRGGAENYTLGCERYGREGARFLWKFNEDNLIELRRLGAGSLPGFADRASCLVALGEPEAGELERSAAMLAEDGFDVGLVRPGDGAPDDAMWKSGRPVVGLINPHDAVCSPVELLGLLRSGLARAEVVVGSRVYGIEERGDGVLVRCRGWAVEAGRVLVCTNACGPELLPELKGLVEPNRGQMLAMRPDRDGDGRLDMSYYLNHGSEYIRSGPDGTVLVGGARKSREAEERTGVDGINPGVQAELERWARELVTDRFVVTARWSGIMGFSPDGMPIVRACDAGFGAVGRVWFCGGLTGHGMGMGHLTAKVAVGAMLDGAPNPFWLGAGRERRFAGSGTPAR
jgi:glycine/D-amino acid oxidase-like deaminating enzyme